MQEDKKQKLILATILTIKILVISIYKQTEIRLNCLGTLEPQLKKVETFKSLKPL